MSKDQLVGIKIDFHASSYNLGSFSNSALKNDVQYYIPVTYSPDRVSTNSNSGKGNYIESIEAFRIRSDLSRNAQLLIANNFQIETTIEFTFDGLHYLYSDNTSSNVTHLNIRASTTSKNLKIFYGTTLCLSFNYNFVINTKYNIVITYINSRYYLMVNGVECGKSTITAAQNLNSLFQNVTIYQCFYSYKYNANLANGFIGNIYDLIYSFDNKYVHRSINGYSLVNNHLLSNLSFSNTLDIERKNEPSITWDYENVNFGADKIIFDITPMSANIPSKDFKVEFTINDIKLGIHNIAKIDNRYYVDYTVTDAIEPDVEVNENTTAALDFENGIVDQVATTIWNKAGTATVQSTNKIFGENSFETTALGDSLYTNSNIITGGSTPFTIEYYFLYKGKNTPGNNAWDAPIFTKYDGADQGNYLNTSTFNISFYKPLLIGGNTDTENSNIVFGKNKLQPNTINKVTMTYDGSAIRLFVNDKLDNILGSSGLTTNNKPLRFLSRYDDVNSTNKTSTTFGLIDNINIHNGIATKVRDTDPYEEFLVVDLAFDGENNSTKIVDNGRTVLDLVKPDPIVDLKLNSDLVSLGTTWLSNSTPLFVIQSGTSKLHFLNGYAISSPTALAGTKFTFSFNVEFGSVPTSYSGIMDVGGVDGLYFRCSPAGVMQLVCNRSKYVGSNFTIVAGVTYKVTIMIDGTTVAWFINGQYMGMISNYAHNTTAVVKFGYDVQDPATCNFYLDSVKIYNDSLYKLSSFKEYDQKVEYTWTISGNAKLSTTQPFDGFSSLYLNNGRVNSSLIGSLGVSDFTINFDIIRMNDNSDGIFMWGRMLCIGNNSTDGGLYIVRESQSSNIGVYLYQNDYIRLFTTTDSPLVHNKKVNIRVIRENGVFNLYIDDILKFSNSGYTSYNISATNMMIGGNNINSEYINGYLKNFKIYKDIAVIPKQKTTSLITMQVASASINSNLVWSTSGATLDTDSFTGNILNTSGNSLFNFYGSDFVLEFKFKGYGDLFTEWNINQRFSLSVDVNGAVAFKFYESGPSLRTITSDNQTLLSTMNTLKVRRLNGSFSISLNDVGYTLTQPNSPYVGSIYGPTTEGVRIGSAGVTTYSLNVYTEQADSVGKIQLDFDNNVTDKYGNSTWTNNGVTFDQVNSVKGHAAYFDSITTDYLETSSELLNFNKGNFKIDFSFKNLNSSGELFSNNISPDSGGSIWYPINPPNSSFGYLDFYGRPSNTTYNDRINIGNVWYDNSIVKKNNILIEYRNDVVAYIMNGVSDITFNFIGGGKCRIGKPTSTFGAYNGFGGYLDNFKSYKDYQEPAVIDKPAVHLPLETNAINTGFTPLTINSVGSPTYTTIDGKKCIKFESGKYLTINSNNIFNLGTSSDFYMEFDFYVIAFRNGAGGGTDSSIIRITGNWDNNSSAIQFNSNGNILLYGKNNKLYTTTNNFGLNSFNKLIVKRQNSLVSIILNDVVETVNNFELDFSLNGTLLGGVDQSPYAYLNGYMSNFKMFVGTSEIPETYNDKKVLDLDFKPTRKSYLFKDNNNKCVIHPVNITQRDYQDGQYCCTFNGTDQYLRLGKNDLLNFGNDDFVIEVDFETYVINSNNKLLFINASTNDNYRVYLAICSTINSNPKKLEFGITNGSGIYFQVRSDNQLEINTRYKVIIKSENGLISMIINDVTQSITLQNTSSVNLNYNNNTYIAYAISQPTDYFNGTMYSVKVLRNTSNLDLLDETPNSPGSSGSSYDIALYDSITTESSNIIVDTLNDKNILKRIGNELSYSSGSNVINLNAEEKTEETTDIVLFDTFKGSIKNDIKVYDGDYNIDDAEFVNNPITYDYVDIEIAEDEYCESRSFELGDYIIKGFIEGYRNHDYQIIQTNNNFVVAYGNDDFYYDGIEKRFLNDYSVLDVQTGILHKIFDRVMVKGSLQINVVSLLCVGSDYAIRLYRKTDNFFLGDYAIINGMCLIENLDCNTLYDCIIYDRSGIYEGRTLSSRVPTPL